MRFSLQPPANASRQSSVDAADRSISSVRPSAPKAVGAATAFGSVWAAWLWANPYQGIWHDARVYLVMAYRHLVPEAFARDLWFMFGAQDRSSLFDEIYAAVLAMLPVATAAKVVALGGGVVWAAGAVWFARVAIGPRWGLWAAVLLCVLAPPYTFVASKIFVLTESFATARPYAMGLTLTGIAAWLQGYRVGAAVALSAGVALHPLIASWGVLALLGLRVSDRAMAALLLAGAVFAIGVAAAGLGPFQPMEGMWLQLVQSTSVVVIAPGADAVALDQNLWWLAILLLAGRLGTERHRRLYLLVAWLAAWGLFTSVVLSFHFPATWPVQAQPWRSLWLAAAVGIVAGVDVWRCAKNSARVWLWRVAVLVSYVLAGRAFGGALLLVAWCLYACPNLGSVLARLWNQLSSPSRTAAAAASVVWSALVVAFSALPLPYMQLLVPGINAPIAVPTALTALMAPLLLTWGVSSFKGRLRILWMVPLLAIPGILWDQRPSAQRLVESGYDLSGRETSLGGAYRQGDVVYWPGNDLGPWFELATAGYAQNVQAIGIVFSRDHALLLRSRLNRIKDLQPTAEWDWAFSREDLHAPSYYPTQWDGRALQSLCMDQELDHVVLSSPARGLDAHATVPLKGKAALYFYRCAIFRDLASMKPDQRVVH